jgi:hypothetical protein
MRKHPNSHREAKATAPVLDSTRDSTHNALGRGLSLYPHISMRFHYAAVAVIVQLHPPARPVTDPPIRTIPVDLWAIRRR